MPSLWEYTREGKISFSAGGVWALRFAHLLHFEYPFIGLLHFQGKDTRLI